MKFVKVLSLSFLLSASCVLADGVPTTGILLGDTIIPSGAFPTHVANYGLGGWHITTNLALVKDYLILPGTAVWNKSDNKLYIRSNDGGWLTFESYLSRDILWGEDGMCYLKMENGTGTVYMVSGGETNLHARLASEDYVMQSGGDLYDEIVSLLNNYYMDKDNLDATYVKINEGSAIDLTLSGNTALGGTVTADGTLKAGGGWRLESMDGSSYLSLSNKHPVARFDSGNNDAGWFLLTPEGVQHQYISEIQAGTQMIVDQLFTFTPGDNQIMRNRAVKNMIGEATNALSGSVNTGYVHTVDGTASNLTVSGQTTAAGEWILSDEAEESILRFGDTPRLSMTDRSQQNYRKGVTLYPDRLDFKVGSITPPHGAITTYGFQSGPDKIVRNEEMDDSIKSAMVSASNNTHNVSMRMFHYGSPEIIESPLSWFMYSNQILNGIYEEDVNSSTVAIPWMYSNNPVVQIGSECFRFYSGQQIETLYIPRTVVHIQSQAFADTTAIKALSFNGDAPTISTDAFKNTTIEKIMVLDPAAKNWPDYIADSQTGRHIPVIRPGMTADSVKTKMLEVGGNTALSGDATLNGQPISTLNATDIKRLYSENGSFYGTVANDGAAKVYSNTRNFSWSLIMNDSMAADFPFADNLSSPSNSYTSVSGDKRVSIGIFSDADPYVSVVYSVQSPDYYEYGTSILPDLVDGQSSGYVSLPGDQEYGFFITVNRSDIVRHISTLATESMVSGADTALSERITSVDTNLTQRMDDFEDSVQPATNILFAHTSTHTFTTNYNTGGMYIIKLKEYNRAETNSITFRYDLCSGSHVFEATAAVGVKEENGMRMEAVLTVYDGNSNLVARNDGTLYYPGPSFPTGIYSHQSGYFTNSLTVALTEPGHLEYTITLGGPSTVSSGFTSYYAWIADNHKQHRFPTKLVHVVNRFPYIPIKGGVGENLTLAGTTRITGEATLNGKAIATVDSLSNKVDAVNGEAENLSLTGNLLINGVSYESITNGLATTNYVNRKTEKLNVYAVQIDGEDKHRLYLRSDE